MLEIWKILDPSLQIKRQGKRLHAKVGNRAPALKAPCASLLTTFWQFSTIHSWISSWVDPCLADLDLFMSLGLICSVILKFFIAYKGC